MSEPLKGRRAEDGVFEARTAKAAERRERKEFMRKRLLVICGWLMVAIGMAGIILPVLPTTPFLLLAAACFSGTSERAYRFLLKSPVFGPYIRHYRTKQGVSVRTKVQAISLLWALLILGAVTMGKTWAYIVFPIIGAGVTCHLLLIKTALPEKGSTSACKRVKEELP